MMRTVITSGTATDIMRDFKYYKQFPAVGKTGSTQNDGDAWFMGYTPDITVGVWAGYDMQKDSLKKTGCSITVEPGCGTHRAKKIWSKVMNATVENKPELFVTPTFTKPATIVEMTVSGYSGKLPNDRTISTGKLNKDIFNKKFVPTEEDNVLINQKFVSFDGGVYLPKPETPADMVRENVVIRRPKPISQIIKEIEAALPQMPEENRKDISHFYPTDYEDDAAYMIDPRVDDGAKPNAPTGTALRRNADGTNEIVFQPATNPDIVGYRLYRSTDRSGFQRVPGSVVLIGQEARLVDKQATQWLVGYYVTSVDVAGKESSPSRVVYSDGNTADIVPIDNIGMPNGSGTSTGSGTTGAPTPNPSGQTGNKPVPAAPRNLTLKPTAAGLEIAWTANSASDSVNRYDIYYSNKEAGPYEKLQSSNTNKVNYYAILYDGWYRVSASNSNGESLPSKAVQYKK
jgi:penicillin-binding protein